MSQRSITHASFVIEREYAASPARTFAAWADPSVKTRWFGDPDGSGASEYHLDFAVGGRETSRAPLADGSTYSYNALYQDIVPNERIVYTYDMHLGDDRISVSLATIEFRPEGTGTRLVLTEYGAFLDGHDKPADREQGTGDLLNALGAELDRQAAQG
ncbi:SRPBCC family protein [Micromonospora sp. NPDC050417]|uniref:SRPBCC family protein n=1 Tax=Micromonospora sp. NPDC050417 TaxID=3364280 RepID=UPI0037A44E09